MTRETAERNYRSLVRSVVAENAMSLFAAHEFLDLCQELGIDGNWLFDDVRRVRRGDTMKPFPIVRLNRASQDDARSVPTRGRGRQVTIRQLVPAARQGPAGGCGRGGRLTGG
jgi:hypothetical protein